MYHMVVLWYASENFPLDTGEKKRRRVSLKLTTYCTVAVCLKKWLQPGKSQGPFQLSCNTFAVKKVSARQALQIQKTESGLKVLTTMALASHLTVLSANSPQPPFFTQELLLGKSTGLPAPRRWNQLTGHRTLAGNSIVLALHVELSTDWALNIDKWRDSWQLPTKSAQGI